MKKSIKKIAASLLAATMVLGSLTAAYAEEESVAPGVLETIEEGQVLYTVGSAMTTVAWAPEDLTNVMKETDHPGVYSLDINVPASADSLGNYDHRFSICAYDYSVESTWCRTILGVPSVTPDKVATQGENNLTSIRVTLTDTARKVTVFFDSATYAITMKAEDGEPVEYTIGWATYDDTENFLSPADLSELSYDDYKAQLVEAARGVGLDNYGITAVPDFVKLEADLVAKLAAAPEDPTTESTTEEATTAKVTTAETKETAPATTAAATTAKNQATQTGDVAPVALMVVLMAAVAVVAVVAKKKEA